MKNNFKNANYAYKPIKNEDDETDTKKTHYHSDTTTSPENNATNKLYEVNNPLFKIDSYLNTNKNNNNDLEARNSEACNSFLNVLTKTLRNIVTNEDESTRHSKRITTSSPTSQNSPENGQLKIDEISLNPSQEHVQFTLRLPTTCFKREDVEILKNKKNYNSMINAETCTSDDEMPNARFNTNHKCKTNNRNVFDNRRENIQHKQYHQQKTKRKTSLINLNNHSLNSLSSYNRKSISNSDMPNFKRIICLIVLTFLINPLTGFIAIYYAIKSKRSNDYYEMNKLYKSAYYSIITGFSITALIVLTYFVYTCYFQFIVSIQSRNSSFVMSEIINKSNISQTSLPVEYTKKIELTSTPRVWLPKMQTTKIRSGKAKQYDRLSILIDHDLLKNLKVNTELFQKLRLTNDSFILD